jgi:enoyl-CoA hydratase/carnithine racemase
MKSYKGKALAWEWHDGIIELTLDREPANEIGTVMLSELEQFVSAFPALSPDTAACIISGSRKSGFSAGADLRELYEGAASLPPAKQLAGVRDFLERIHAVTCDIIIADKMARFAFPELRLGLIPGFGGIPRLKRDLGNAFVRDLLLTGRSVNATRAQSAGLIAQLAAEGEALKIARATAAQIKKFDATTSAAAKKFIKPIPHDELRREIDLFCELFTRPAVMAALKKFVESTDTMPYLP